MLHIDSIVAIRKYQITKFYYHILWKYTLWINHILHNLNTIDLMIIFQSMLRPIGKNTWIDRKNRRSNKIK